MRLVPHTDPALATPCPEFDFGAPPADPSKLAHDMVDFMYGAGGIGLAANQVGLPHRVFVMRASPENLACFNPRVVLASSETILLEESCLTYPGLSVRVKRPKHVKVRFQGPDGDTHTRQMTGITARVFQHELGHLNGETFYNLASRYHRDAALRRWRAGRVG
jgi:peptide deformylase